MADEAREADGFEEKTFFEYHFYTLGRRSSLPDNSTKQIELFPAVAAVAVREDVGLLRTGRDVHGLRRQSVHRSQFRHHRQQEGRYLSELQELAGERHGRSDAVRPRAREQARHRRRLARVHRRGPHRPHAEERNGAAQARLRLRCGGRAPAGGLQDRHQPQHHDRRDRNQSAQPQGRAGQGDREGKSLPLDQLEDRGEQSGLREAGFAHDSYSRSRVPADKEVVVRYTVRYTW